MTTTETVVGERLDDLREETPGSIRATIDHLLGAAWDALYERQHDDADGILTALGHVDAALVVLTTYRARLAVLNEQDREEHAEAWGKEQRQQ
jgi:hypothetical protein